MKTCSTCKGSGFIPKYAHIENGKCFQCDGSGEIERTTSNERIEQLETKFVIVESKYLEAKKVIESAMNDFTTGIIDPFQLADICGKFDFNKMEKDYHEWIKVIEEEKKLLAAL